MFVIVFWWFCCSSAKILKPLYRSGKVPVFIFSMMSLCICKWSVLFVFVLKNFKLYADPIIFGILALYSPCIWCHMEAQNTTLSRVVSLFFFGLIRDFVMGVLKTLVWIMGTWKCYSNHVFDASHMISCLFFSFSFFSM